MLLFNGSPSVTCPYDHLSVPPTAVSQHSGLSACWMISPNRLRVPTELFLFLCCLLPLLFLSLHPLLYHWWLQRCCSADAKPPIPPRELMFLVPNRSCSDYHVCAPGAGTGKCAVSFKWEYLSKVYVCVTSASLTVPMRRSVRGLSWLCAVGSAH